MLSLILIQFFNIIKPTSSYNDFPEVLKYREIFLRRARTRVFQLFPLKFLVSIVLFICSFFYCHYSVQIIMGLLNFLFLMAILLRKKRRLFINLTDFLFLIILILIPPFFILSEGDPKTNSLILKEAREEYLKNKTAIFFFIGVFVSQLQILSIMSGHFLLSLLQTVLIVITYTIILIESKELNLIYFLAIFIHLYLIILLIYNGCQKLEQFFLKDNKLKQLKMFQFFVEKIETNSAFILSATQSIGDRPDIMEILSPGRSPLLRNQNAVPDGGVALPSNKFADIAFKIDYHNQEAKRKYNFQAESDFFTFIDNLFVVSSREKSWFAYNLNNQSIIMDSILHSAENLSEEGFNLSSGKNTLLQIFKKTFLNKERLDYFEQNYGSPLKKKRKNPSSKGNKKPDWKKESEKTGTSGSNSGPSTRMPHICFEYACISRDHQNQKLQVKVLPFMFDDKVSLFIFFNDISEKVQNEKLQALDKYKDQVLATVTHDLRSPLNVIMNSLDILSSLPNIDDAGKKFIVSGRVNGKLLNSLINDILDYAQIKEGKIRMNYEPVAFEDIYRELKFMFEYQAKMKNISFLIQYQPGIPTEIFTDRDRLKQVLINLLTNAFKFTKNGRVKLRVSYPRNQIEKDYLKIAVRDSGSGIPKNFIPRLFKPYATMNSKDNSNSKGIGLGLLICRNLVSIMGPFQKIFVRSREGIGTVFWFYIYFKKQPIQDEARLMLEKKEISNNNQNKTFLEDKITLLKVIGSKKILSENDEENRDERSLESDNLGEEDASIKRSDLPSIRSSSSSGQTEYLTYTNVSNSISSNSSGTIQSNATFNSNSGSNSSSGIAKSGFNIKVRRFEKNYESFPEDIGEEEEKTPSPDKVKKHFLIPPNNAFPVGVSTNALKAIHNSTESIGISNLLAVGPENVVRANNGPSKSFLLRVPRSKNETIIVNSSRPGYGNSIKPTFNTHDYPSIQAPEKEDDDRLLETYESQEEDGYENNGILGFFTDKPKKKDKHSTALLESHKASVMFQTMNASGRISEHKSTGIGVEDRPEADLLDAKFALVVDDDNFNHQIYQQQLLSFSKDNKIRLESRFNGKEAVELVESLLMRGDPLPIFIIMDYEMPILKGVEATKKIQDLCNSYGREQINVLGVTGNSRKDDIDDGIAAGMQAVLTKPVSGKQLLEKLREFV